MQPYRHPRGPPPSHDKFLVAHVYLKNHTGFCGAFATEFKTSRNGTLCVNLVMGMKSNLLVKILGNIWGETELHPVLWILTPS